MSFPHHMRRRHDRGALSVEQHQRFTETQNARRRELLYDLIRQEIRVLGLSGFEYIESVASEAMSEFEE